MSSQKKSYFLPKTPIGKWSVGLNIFFLLTIITSVILVNGLGILSFDNHWWDLTVGIVFPMEIIAFILGIMAMRKKDHSVLVYLSIAIGLLTILFILLHSLFISD